MAFFLLLAGVVVLTWVWRSGKATSLPCVLAFLLCSPWDWRALLYRLCIAFSWALLAAPLRALFSILLKILRIELKALTNNWPFFEDTHRFDRISQEVNKEPSQLMKSIWNQSAIYFTSYISVFLFIIKYVFHLISKWIRIKIKLMNLFLDFFRNSDEKSSLISRIELRILAARNLVSLTSENCQSVSKQ